MELVVHECFFTPEQWMRISGFPYKQAYWVTSVIHTPPQGFGKNAGVTNVKAARVGLQVFIDQCTDAHCSTGMVR